jgi:hypothetical protein
MAMVTLVTAPHLRLAVLHWHLQGLALQQEPIDWR